jgi:hypothetical protein
MDALVSPTRSDQILALRHYVSTLLLPDLWKQLVLPYVGRIHMYVWMLPDSTRSSRDIDRLLADTLTLAFEELVGIEYWQTVMKPTLETFGAMVTGSWPLQVISGVEFDDSTDVDIVYPYRKPEDDESRLYDRLTSTPLVSNTRLYDRLPSPQDTEAHVGGTFAEKWYRNLKGVISVQLLQLKLVNSCGSVNSSSSDVDDDNASDRDITSDSTPCPKRMGLIHVRNATDEIDSVYRPVDIRQWIETQFDFDICSTIVDVSNHEQPVTLSSRTTLDRMVALQSSFRWIGDPAMAWERYHRYRRRGVRFDPIDRSDLQRQYQTFLSAHSVIREWIREPPVTIYLRVMNYHDLECTTCDLQEWQHFFNEYQYLTEDLGLWIERRADDEGQMRVWAQTCHSGDKRLFRAMNGDHTSLRRIRFELYPPTPSNGSGTSSSSSSPPLQIVPCKSFGVPFDEESKSCIHSILYPTHVHFARGDDMILVLLNVDPDAQDISLDIDGHPSPSKRPRVCVSSHT